MRACLCALLMSLASTAHAAEGFNLPGSDYDNFVADSVLVCRQTCAADLLCKAYTWVKPNIQGPRGRCWLKERVPNLVKDSCCDSGYAQEILSTQLRPEGNTNRPGMDYRNFATSSYQSCQAACTQESRCMAWTWVKSGTCWLKDGKNVPRPVADNNTVSGVKLRQRSAYAR